METRASPNEEPNPNRPAISRRSVKSTKNVHSYGLLTNPLLISVINAEQER
jgi:hypothetical protein